MYFAGCQFSRSLFASERGLPTPDKFFPQKQPNVKWRSTNNFFPQNRPKADDVKLRPISKIVL